MKLHRDHAAGIVKFLPLGNWRGKLKQQDLPLKYVKTRCTKWISAEVVEFYSFIFFIFQNSTLLKMIKIKVILYVEYLVTKCDGCGEEISEEDKVITIALFTDGF